jgi:SpoVK/Ycf46/Vps4 family AAA+-type ATPase
MSLGDFIVRRTGRLYFERPTLEAIYPIIHQHIKSKVEISENVATQDLTTFETEYQAVMNFRK